MSLMPFHLAIPVHDLPAARRFYGEVFGLSEGRSAEHWVDFDFFGHQLVIHQHPQTDSQRHAGSNPVDGHDVPVPHFGVVLAWDDWHALAERLKQRGTRFVIEPYIRFKARSASRPRCFSSTPAATRWSSRASATWASCSPSEIAGAPPGGCAYCAQSVQNSSAAQLDCSSGRLDVAHSFLRTTLPSGASLNRSGGGLAGFALVVPSRSGLKACSRSPRRSSRVAEEARAGVRARMSRRTR